MTGGWGRRIASTCVSIWWLYRENGGCSGLVYQPSLNLSNSTEVVLLLVVVVDCSLFSVVSLLVFMLSFLLKVLGAEFLPRVGHSLFLVGFFLVFSFSCVPLCS